MKAMLRTLAEWPWRLMPPAMRTAIVKGAIFAAARRPAREALIELLEIDRVVSGQIDLAALEYGDGVHVKHRIMRYHDFFVERITAADRVLDIGCGYGAVANSIASRSGAEVVGLDLSAANVASARSRFQHDRLSFVHGEAPQTLPPGRFDVVVMSNVLEHIEHRVAFLREVQARIHPARWLIRVPMFNRDWRPSLRSELGLYAFSDPTHFTEYTRESFESEMLEAGFAIRHLHVNWGEIWAEVAARHD